MQSRPSENDRCLRADHEGRSRVSERLKLSFFLKLLFSGFRDIRPRMRHHRPVGMVDDESRRASRSLFDVAALDVVHLDLVAVPALRVPGRQGSRFLKGAVRELLLAALDDHVGTGDPLRVEPPVAAGGDPEGDLFILVIVFPDVDVEAVAGDKVKRL